MKKVLLPLGTAILLSTSVNGQTGFGLKAGINFSSYSYSKSETLSEANTSLNYHVSGYLDARLTSRFYLHPEFSLQKKGAELIESNLLGGTQITQSIIWLDLPVNFIGKIPINGVGNVFAGAGPYLGFAISGENKYPENYSNTSGQSPFIFSSDNSWKSTDYGANFLAGFKFSKRFLLNTSYRIGMANLAGKTNKWSKDIKNRVLSIGIGVEL